MMRLLFLFVFLSSVAFGQTTAIPDANFEQALIDLGYDDVIDGAVLTANVSSVTILNVPNKSIADLTGIEDFVALEELYCQFNDLTSLDVSNNTALEELYCQLNDLTSLDFSNNTALYRLNCFSNQLTYLNVSNNAALWHLNCSNNPLTSIDVSNNTALESLHCYFNQLTSLDVSGCTALLSLNCDNNQLTSLDVSNNTAFLQLDCMHNQLTCLNVKNGNNLNMWEFEASYNPALTCIEVDDPAYSDVYWVSSVPGFDFDLQTSFSEDCNNACSNTSSLTELTSSKNLIQILDVMGRETSFKPNTPLVYVYDDGSTKKVFVAKYQ